MPVFEIIFIIFWGACLLVPLAGVCSDNDSDGDD